MSGSGVPLGREGQDAAESPRARGAQLPVGDHDVTSLPTSCCILCSKNSVHGLIKMWSEETTASWSVQIPQTDGLSVGVCLVRGPQTAQGKF